VAALNAVHRPMLHLPSLIQRWAQIARTLRDDIETALGSDGVILYPTAVDIAPRHSRQGILHFRFPLTFNALGLPATQVPLGLGRKGLPLGIQVVGPRGCDHRTIAVAVALENVLGGWTPPAR
jgi:fatty acid amide hydrolase 2